LSIFRVCVHCLVLAMPIKYVLIALEVEILAARGRINSTFGSKAIGGTVGARALFYRCKDVRVLLAVVRHIIT
jgi:hypothetical protein